MIDAVITNLIKFIEILLALITSLNILEDTHAKKKKTPNAEKFSINP